MIAARRRAIGLVSLITTIRNEARGIHRFVEAIEHQTRPPDQIVVVDGGSVDGTVDLLREAVADDSRWLIIESPGASISKGRNLAIAASTHATIAVTDAGAVADPRWLEELLQPLAAEEVDVSAGFFAAGGDSWFERCLGTIITPTLAEIDPPAFLPSSRSVAFRRGAFDATDGYPEWLSHCEDLVFDLDLRRAGAVFSFAPRAIVRWNARPSLSGFAKQYFHYARGDGDAGLFPKRHLVRYATYASTAGVISSRRPALISLLPLGYLLYATRYHRRVAAAPKDVLARSSPAHAMVPIVLIVGDVSKMLGYPVGLARRRRRRDR